MSILIGNKLGLSFGAFDLFKGISCDIANESKIGLIGANGIGKTSLLQILVGTHQSTTGEVRFARGKRLGYLRQEAVEIFSERTNTVYEEMLSIFSNLISQQKKLHELERRMSAGDYSDSLLNAYGELQAKFEINGGYDFDLRIQQTLEGLNLGKRYWRMPMNHLSGGQKTRVLLARLLLEKPDLLVMDEPTNHLDIEAVEYLEQVLKDYEGAFLIVSHDRYFMDNTVNTIWEMTAEGIEIYHGNYSSYLLQREERWDYYERVFEEEKSRMLKEVDFIQKNWVRASTHARALGLLKRLSRDLAIVDNYGIMTLRSGKKWSELGLSSDRPLDVLEATRKVNALRLGKNRPPRLHMNFAAEHTSGMMVVRADNVIIGYPGQKLFTARNLELRKGERAALIGPNGSGKTTFLKVLIGQLNPLEGKIYVGSSVKIGYFAQAEDSLNDTNSVIDELINAKSMAAQTARSYLAKFLFKGDDVLKPVQVLSGGERARLALAIMSLEGANLLLLDEPTNHLDIPAREALEEVLESFDGSIILVSHDRFLVNKLATKVWSLHDNKFSAFNGNYRQFVLNGAAGALHLEKRRPVAVRQAILPAKPLFQINGKEARQKAQSLAMLEERIHNQEITIQHMSIELQKAGKVKASSKIQQISMEIAKAQARLDSLMTEWEKAA